MESESRRKRKRNYSSECSSDENSGDDSELARLQLNGEASVTSNERGCQTAVNKEECSIPLNIESESPTAYKKLGHETFSDLKKITVTSKWVAAGVTFPADLSDDNLVKLKEVPGLHPLLYKAVKENIRRWFPVQKAVLPSLISDTNCPPLLPPRDLAISAPTGSGKTLCYIIPIINSLARWAPSCGVYALIVAPVQNLVVQIENEFKKYNCFTIPTAVLSGGQDVSVEKKQLKTASVVFATPGRLAEHLFEPDSVLNLSFLRYLVIDEADRMHQTARLEWLDAVETASNASLSFNSINDLCKGRHLQKILVSATLSHDVENLHIWRLRYPRLFRATKTNVREIKQELAEEKNSGIESSILPISLKHKIIICRSTIKPLAVYSEIMKQLDWKRILIFVNNRLASQRLTMLLKFLSEGTFGIEELSSNLFGRRRLKVLNRFIKGTTKVLISSDVLSRGIDVQNIDAVVNYDNSQNERHFVHRVGRTARCGKEGVAVSIVSTKEKRALENILQSLDGLNNLETETFTIFEQDPLLDRYHTALETLKESVQLKQKKVKKRLASHKAPSKIAKEVR